MVWIRKVCGFVPVFRAKTAQSFKFDSFLKILSSDNLVGHDKDGHGNLDIDFSGSLHIH